MRDGGDITNKGNLEACGKAGVHDAIIISSGFSEAGNAVLPYLVIDITERACFCQIRVGETGGRLTLFSNKAL